MGLLINDPGQGFQIVKVSTEVNVINVLNNHL